MGEGELSIEVKTPFRGQPILVQIACALFTVGVVLFGLAVPTHLLVAALFDPNGPNPAAWQIPVLVIFLGAFFAFGFWMTSGLIGAGYELRRPGRTTGVIAGALLGIQALSVGFGFWKTLFLAEVIAIPVCLVGGAVLHMLGEEISEIAAKKSCGGGIGALAGLIVGFMSGNGWYLIGAPIVLGLVVEGTGRTVRYAIRQHSASTDQRKAGPSPSSSL